jgi:two-component system, LytTR family, response regulator
MPGRRHESERARHGREPSGKPAARRVSEARGETPHVQNPNTASDERAAYSSTSDASPITTLIVDDERLSRERMITLLSGEPDIAVVGECENGLQALAAMSEASPELVFLDVQMPDLDGIGVIEALGEDFSPEIIFVTAHSSYMERAFELHAVDYLRKPYTNARFASALTHARRRVQARRQERAGQTETPIARRLAPVLAALQGARVDPRIAVRDHRTSTWHIIRTEEIDLIHAEGSSLVSLRRGKESFLWRKTLAELEETLDPEIFLRLHRSYIVNATRIRQVKPLQKGEYALILADGTMLDTGRTYRETVERFLHGHERG